MLLGTNDNWITNTSTFEIIYRFLIKFLIKNVVHSQKHFWEEKISIAHVTHAS